MSIEKKAIFTAILISLAFVAFSSPPSRAVTTWNRTYLGRGYPNIGFIQTNDGGYAITGWSAHAKSGAKTNEAVLIKTDSSGAKSWSKTYSDPYGVGTNTVIQTKDGGYTLLGYIGDANGNSHIWLVKVDSAGQVEWNKTFVNDIGNALIQTADGGYAMAGASVYGFLFAKIDSVGNVKINKYFSNTGSTDSPAPVETAILDEARSIIQTNDGGYVMAGGGQSRSNQTKASAYLLKIDSSGQLQWIREFQSNTIDYAQAVIQTQDGGYAMVGYSSTGDTSDLLAIKTDASGNIQWRKTYGGSSLDFGACLAQSADGGYALLGSTQSYGAGGLDYWLIKIDSTGTKLWDKTYGGARDEGAGVIVLTQDVGYALAGYSDSFGDGEKNFWVVKTDENGVTSGISSQSTAPPTQAQATNIPFWAFNGAYAKYETSILDSGANKGIELTLTVNNVDTSDQTCDFNLANNASISNLSFSQTEAPLTQSISFAMNNLDLIQLNNGQVPEGFQQGTAQITPSTIVSLPSGTYVTDQVDISDSAVTNGSMWIDMYSGLMVKASAGFQLQGIATSSAIQLVETNISPKTTSNELAFSGGVVTLDDTANTGVKVEIVDSDVPDGVSANILIAGFGTKMPSAMGAVQVNGLAFYDVKVISNDQLVKDTTATIYLTHPAFSSSNVISYWDGREWIQCSSSFNSPNTIAAAIPVSALTGTLITVSSSNTSANGLFLSNDIIIMIASVVAVLLALVVSIFLVKRRRERTSRKSKNVSP